MTQAVKDDLMNKFFVALAIGLLGWNIKTTYDLSIKVAVISQQIEDLKENLNDQVSELDSGWAHVRSTNPRTN